MWLDDDSFLWANKLDKPLVKYTISVEGKNILIKEHIILTKAGHCRLTMDFVQENPGPAYDITYSVKLKYFFSNIRIKIEYMYVEKFIYSIHRLLFWSPLSGGLDFFHLCLQQSSHSEFFSLAT